MTLEPAAASFDETYSHGGHTFAPGHLAIVGKAIDAGIFYQDQFKAACLPAWQDAFPVQDMCLTQGGNGAWVDASGTQEARALRDLLKEQLRYGPRGAWALIRRAWSHEQGSGVSWTGLIYDGIERVHEPQTSHLGREPTFVDLLDGMVAMEIYLTRQAEQYRRECVASREIIASHGWRVGSALKDITLGSDDYSSAVVTGVGDCLLTLALTKRRSAKRWEWTGFAQRIRQKGSAEPRGDSQTAMLAFG